MRVVIYTKDGPDASSSYYRLLQYRSAIEAASKSALVVRVLVPDTIRRWRYDISGVNPAPWQSAIVRSAYAACTFIFSLYYMCLDSIRGTEILIVSRSLTPRSFIPPVSWLYRALLAHAKRTIWDFDDDIVEGHEIGAREFSLLAHSAGTIVVTHNELMSLLPPRSRSKTVLLPTTDGDLLDSTNSLTSEARRTSFARQLRMVWVASSSGLPDLGSVAQALDEAAEAVSLHHNKIVTLEVVCNVPFQYHFRHLQLINTRWTREEAKRAILEAHVGLMPLRDSRYARGKGGFKVVQYMAGGLPTVASNVGFNRDVVVHESTGLLVDNCDGNGWKRAITRVACCELEWIQMSDAASERWSTEFSFERAARFWGRLMTATPARPFQPGSAGPS